MESIYAFWHKHQTIAYQSSSGRLNFFESTWIQQPSSTSVRSGLINKWIAGASLIRWFAFLTCSCANYGPWNPRLAYKTLTGSFHPQHISLTDFEYLNRQILKVSRSQVGRASCKSTALTTSAFTHNWQLSYRIALSPQLPPLTPHHPFVPRFCHFSHQLV